MPELPEVEVIRQDLENEVLKKKIHTAQVRFTKNAMRAIRRHSRRRDFEDPLAGATITQVERRGKYLIFHLDNHHALVVHLGMSGQLLLSDASIPMSNHTHVVLNLAPEGQLRCIDPRTFGELFVTEEAEMGKIAELQGLGMDPLLEGIPWQFFRETLDVRRTKLKSLLMDQRLICGIGNIYSDEILFASGLRYDRSSETLSPSEVRRLYRAIQQVLQEAIKHRGTSIDDEQYRDLYGATGAFQPLLKVYQREGQSCLRCRATLARARWSNRSTYFCPSCQV